MIEERAWRFGVRPFTFVPGLGIVHIPNEWRRKELKGIYIYQPQDCAAPVQEFVDGLEEKLRDKLIRQFFRLSHATPAELREPHYKHFVIERYRELYELRERGKVMVRIIFTLRKGGGVTLLYAFVKRQSRDTMLALEQSL